MNAVSTQTLSVPGFEVVGILGRGGSGVVFEARATVDGAVPKGSVVALKILRDDLALAERERRRFFDEAERMRRVEHDGLMPLHDVGVLNDGRPFLVMPLLRGETLAKRLTRGQLDPQEAVRIFSVLANAVDALHAAELVHRDIKPENVFLEDRVGVVHPVLLDFGIARERGTDASTTTAEGRIRGTPAYMAPERFFGAQAGVESDVYELGVVLYLMLVGRLPWGSEENVNERLNPRSPSEADRAVPERLAALVLSALSTRPEVRPKSAAEFAIDAAASLVGSLREGDMRKTVDIDVRSPSTPPPPDVVTGVMTAQQRTEVMDLPRRAAASSATSIAPAPRKTSGFLIATVAFFLLSGATAVAMFGGLHLFDHDKLGHADDVTSSTSEVPRVPSSSAPAPVVSADAPVPQAMPSASAVTVAVSVASSIAPPSRNKGRAQHPPAASSVIATVASSTPTHAPIASPPAHSASTDETYFEDRR